MRVINPPRKITLPSGQHSWEFDCDDGKTYGSTELALLIGLGSGHSLLQRLTASAGTPSGSWLRLPDAGTVEMARRRKTQGARSGQP